MKRGSVLVALPLLALLLALAVLPLTAQQTFKSGANLVVVPVVVVDGKGAMVDIMSGSERARHGLRMIDALTDQVVKAPHPRKVMVFIGNAYMFSPEEPSAFGDAGLGLMAEWMDAVRATARNNVSVYVIDPQGLQASPGDWSKSFAEETGGYAWGRTNNFPAAVDQIFRDSASYYLVGYPAPVNDDRLHKIDVKVARPGVTVRARRARR